MDRHLAQIVPDAAVGPAVQQELHHLLREVPGRVVKDGAAIVRLGVYVRPGLHKQAQHGQDVLGYFPRDRLVQRSPSGVVTGVDVRRPVALKERSHLVQVSSLDGQVQRRLAVLVRVLALLLLLLRSLLLSCRRRQILLVGGRGAGGGGCPGGEGAAGWLRGLGCGAAPFV